MNKKIITQLGKDAGFDLIGVSSPDTRPTVNNYKTWLAQGYQGEMTYLESNLSKRLTPQQLMPNVKNIVSCAVNYYPGPNIGLISNYALGRDYHKVVKKMLKQLTAQMAAKIPGLEYRYFVDSAPVLQKHFATQSGIGWQGKNSLIINPQYGSWLFLGTIFTNLELTLDKPMPNHCGNCTKCLQACPTQAIVAPKVINASHCISYLTIEHKGSISNELHAAIGSRIYGCDQCQLACPWNRFAKPTKIKDFLPRNNLDKTTLNELANWTEQDFLKNFAGSAIRRIGYKKWQQNIRIAR